MAFQPVFSPSMNISSQSKAINIDGEMGDDGWKSAVWTDQFVERTPGDNTEPPVKTKIMLTHDTENLYIGFICYDDPGTIRATMCQRDQFNGDDAVSVFIDTYGDASWAYKFMVNAHGVQKDFLWTNIVGDDIGYDLIWNSAAQITSKGYQVEIAIPFSSIRFPGGDIQDWKMDFRRNRPRESYSQYSWAANDRNEQCDPCQWGTVTGIRDVRPGRGIEILPTIIANQAGSVTNIYDPEIPFENDDISGDLSLGGKYTINSDITMEAAMNPDFSQIESDAAQIDVNTPIALFFPEKRPFFQEGRDIFRTLFNSFYTRTINDPQFAAKVIGRAGSNRFGFVSAVDENSYYLIPLEEGSIQPFNIGKSYVNVLRGMHSFGETAQLGLIVNDRRYEAGGHNSILALDQRIRLSRNYRIDGQYIVTDTKEPNDSSLYYSPRTFDQGKYTLGFDGESYTGYGFITRVSRNSRHLNMFVDYNQVGRAYRTETGYDPWVNYRNFSVWTGYNIYFDNGIYQQITPQIYSETRWNFEGDRKWTHTNISLDNHTRFAQTNYSISYNIGSELWRGKQFNNLWHIHLDANSTLSSAISSYFSVEYGNGAALNVLQKGKELSFSSGGTFKPIDRLQIEPNIDYLISKQIDTREKLFENYVIRTRFSVQATKSLSLRIVAQYTFLEMLLPIEENGSITNAVYTERHWDFDPLITFKLSPFSVFYIGTTYDYTRLPADPYPFYSPEPNPNLSSKWNLSSRQFFMKLQYLFQT